MEIKDLSALLIRNARSLVLGLILGAVVGFIVAVVQSPVYEATTKILVSQTRQQSNADTVPLSIDQLVTTYLQLVKTQPVLDEASSQLGIKIKADNIQVAAISNTQIIQIKVQDKDAQRAAAIANALFDVLVQQNETLQSGRYITYEDALNTRIGLVQKQISDLQAQVNQINAVSIQEQLTQVNQEIDQLQNEISVLEKDIYSLPTTLTDVQRASLAQTQAQLDRTRSLMALYQQIKANLTFLGTPGQGSTPNNDPRLLSLQSTLNVYQQLNISLLNNLEAVRLARMQNTPNVTQIDPAMPPKAPIRPLPFLYVMLGGVVGLILSTSFILMMDHIDDTLNTASQTEELLGLPVLGFVSDGSHTKNGLITVRDPLSAEAEAFRGLAVSLELISADKKVCTMLVMNAGPAENKTTIAANLALVNAQQGKRVILLDGDLKHPNLHNLFEIENQMGVINILQDNIDIKSASHFVEDLHGITLIPSGAVPKDSTRWLDAGELAKLFLKLEKQADLVIVDGPSVDVADAQLLASNVDAVLLTIKSGHTRVDSAQASLKRFRSIGARVVGAILDRTPQYRTIKPPFLHWVKIKPGKNKVPQNVVSEIDAVSPS